MRFLATVDSLFELNGIGEKAGHNLPNPNLTWGVAFPKEEQVIGPGNLGLISGRRSGRIVPAMKGGRVAQNIGFRFTAAFSSTILESKSGNPKNRGRFPSRATGIAAGMAVLLVGPAAWASDPVPPSVLAHRSEPATAQNPDAAPSMTLTIPAETEVATELLSGIHTQVSQEGDSVTARLSKPLYINGRLALPLGTLLDGRITKIRPARRMNRPAELALRFERIALPDGQAEPVRGVLAGLEKPKPPRTRFDSEGYLKGAPRVSWKGLAVGFVALSVLAIARVPVAGSGAVGAALPASGASLLSYALIWRRGNEVHLPPETRFRVRLTYPVTLSVHW